MGSTTPIAPEVLAEFQSAPADVASEVRRLESLHIKHGEKLLQFSDTPTRDLDDPRDDAEHSPANVEVAEAPNTMEKAFKSADETTRKRHRD